MAWPRGRYNGQRIVGFVVKVRVDLLWWGFRLPSIKYGQCGSLGPLHVWLEAAYAPNN
jgi:hypothetical protein